MRVSKSVKKVFSVLLAFCMVLGYIPATAFAYAEETEPVYAVKTVAAAPDVGLPGNDELFAMYAEQKLYGYEISTFGTKAGEQLTGDEKLVYDALVPYVKQIAAGTRSSSVIGLGMTLENIPMEDGTTVSYTADTELTFTGAEFSQAQLDNVLSALMSDYPYDMYWYDKVTGTEIEEIYGTTLMHLRVYMTVAANYRTGTYTADTAKTGSAATAAANAQAVVNSNASKSDYEKLAAYKNWICENVSYNSAAADADNFTENSDPWQLIYVFDGVSTTNVVCEGYSKAFQYLCDLGGLDCICVSGTMAGATGAGAHMWNVVTLEGNNYLVDVTNSDTGTVGSDGSLFLVGGTYADGKYTFTCSGTTVTFTCSDLNLAATSYGAGEDEHVCSAGALVAGQSATCVADGWMDYYQCGDAACGKLYSDAAFSIEITDLDAWKAGDGKLLATGEHSFTTKASSIMPVPAQCGQDALYYVQCDNCDAVSETETVAAEGTALEHIDEDRDHICDHGCGKTDMGTHEDKNKDHACDYGCYESFGIHEDTNEDHACDYGCDVPIGPHDDGEDDTDHLCDYCQKSVEGEECVDYDLNHACDECNSSMGTHEDKNKDHACDYGCSESFGECSDSSTDQDHVCDYGCGWVIESCFDQENDDDHSCDVCGAENVTEHWGETTVENEIVATCEKGGSYDLVERCTECGKEMSKIHETVGARGHDWSNAEYTWSEDGKSCTAERYCFNDWQDNHRQSADATVTSSVSIEATCYYMGWTLYTASFAVDWAEDGQTTEREDISMTDHKYDDVVVTDPSCSEGGYTTYTCSVCGDWYDADETDSLGHSYDDGVVTWEPSCIYTGEMTFTCTECGDWYTEEIAATGEHSYDNGVISIEPTCTAVGEKIFTCSECGESYTEEVAATGHSKTDVSYEDNGDGTHEVICNVCGDTIHESADHTFDETTHICTGCGEKEQLTVTFMNGEDVWQTIDKEYGSTLGIAGMPVPEAPTGMVFSGWYTEGGVHVYHGMTVTDNLVAYATWEEGYTITWMADGEIYEVTFGKHGDTLAVPESPTKENYHFVKWDTEIPATIPAENMTITAVWEACSGGTASCSKKAVCSGCGEEYGAFQHTGTKSYSVNATDSVNLHDATWSCCNAVVSEAHSPESSGNCACGFNPISSVTITGDASVDYGESGILEAAAVLAEGYTAITTEYAWSDGTTMVDTSFADLDAGDYSYTCTITVDGYKKTGSVNVTVNPIVPEYTEPTALTDLTYTGAAQSLILAGEAASGQGTMKYSLTADGEYSTDIPTGTAAGDYTVYYKVVGNGPNYTDSDVLGFVSVTIDPTTVTVTAYAQSKIYSKENPELTYRVDGLIGSDTLTGALATTATKDSDVGEYDITMGTLSAGDNYTISYTGAKLTVTPFSLENATVTLSQDTFTYDGEVHKPGVTVKLNGITLTQDVDYTVTYRVAGSMSDGKPTAWLDLNAYPVTFTDAGIMYYAVVEGTGNYYTENDTTLYGNYVIKPKTVTELTFDGLDEVYAHTGSAIVPTFTVKDGETTLNYGTDYMLDFENNTNVGTAAITVTLKGNYSGTVAESFEIKIHTHDWSYALNDAGDTIIATCEGGPGACPDGEQSFTLNASDAVYSGEMVDAEVTRNGMDLTFTLRYTGTNGYDSEDAPTDAGDYTVTMTVGDKSVSDSFTISPKPIANCSISLSENSFTYTGKAPVLTVTVVDNGVGSTALTENTHYIVGTVAVNAGSHKLIVTGKGNYGGSAELDYSIAAKEVVVTGTQIKDVTYNAEGYTLEVSDVTFSGVVEGETLDYTASAELKGYNGVGTQGAEVTVTLKNSNYVLTQATVLGKVTINKAVSTVTAAPTANELTYTGAEQALATAGTTADGTLVYSLSEDGVYTETIPTGKAAGEYTVWYYVQGDSNHIDSAKASVSVKIEKAALTVTAKDNAITYGDAPAANGVEYSGFVGEENEGVLSGKVSVTCNYERYGNVGTYAITPGGLTSENYEITFQVGELTVTAKAITVTADAQTKTYGEADPNLTYTVEGLINGDKLSGALARENGANAGTYAITQGTLTAGSNYSIHYTGANLTVNPKAVTITAKDQTITYGETVSGAEISASGLLDGHAAAATLTPSTENVTVNGTVTPNAAVITADGSDVTANYAFTYASGKLVIAPDTSKIDALTTENVTSANEKDIKAVQAMMASAETEGVDDATAEDWAAITASCEELLEKIEEVAEENKAVTDQAADFDEETVNSADKEELKALAQDIEALLDTGNLTEEERTALETVLEQVEDMIDTIEETAEDSKAAADAIGALDAESVTSDDKEEIVLAIGAIDELLEADHLTEEERAALNDTKADAKALLAVIEAARAAANTENTEKVQSVTAKNVKPEDKEALINAKADLEKALKDNSGNYTAEEKQAIQDEIRRIETAMAALENVEDVTGVIKALPETVEPDDEEVSGKILDAKKAYDALTDHEKSLVDKTTKEKLDGLVAGLTDYKIIKGDGSKWTTSSNGLSFTANGPFSKFIGIEVDGKKVADTYYTAESGSTVITLKKTFLKRLSVGEHTITVLYTDGETSGTFKIYAEASSPATGDESDIMMWSVIMTLSALGLIALMYDRKRRITE